MVNIILWIIFGGLAGWLATFFVDSDFGILGNVVVGILGAFLGGFIMDKLGHGGAPGAERPTSILPFLTAVGGAILLLFLVNLVF
jgi:uncharacterized membrane protein YeaQ/YmgE (transglycosylase-associated protein family)